MTDAAPSRRIAFFMHDFANGGVERMRLHLCAALAARGHHVTLVTVRAQGPLCDALPQGITLVDLAAGSTWRAIPQLARWLRQAKPDVLVSSLGHNNIAAILARAIAFAPARLVICQHNTLSEERRLGWQYQLLPLAYRLLGPAADAIVAVSDGVAQDLALTTGLDGARVKVIFNPVLASPPRPSADAAPPHPWLADPALRVFVTAGRLVAQKDPLTALRAFALHATQHAAARLIFLGDGPLLEAIVTEAASLGIADRVLCAGYVPKPERWFTGAAAVLLTSRYEGFGNVIVEALASGTPVISTDCPHGPAEILCGGAFGRLAPPGDASAIAALMDADLRTLFPASLLRARAAVFTAEACARAHEALFERILARAAPDLFGLQFSALDARQVAEHMLLGPRPTALASVVTPNADHIRLLRDPAFRDACAQARLICADGWPIAAYAWLRRVAPLRRVTGCDIVHTLFNHDARHGRRVLIVTEAESTTKPLWQRLARGLAPGWSCLTAPAALGADPDAQALLAAAIAESEPDILILTLGAPVSERFLHTQRHALPPCWALCAGQAVRVELGLTPRAPALLRRAGLEWAWRLVREPRRLGARYARVALSLPPAILADLRAKPSYVGVTPA